MYQDVNFCNFCDAFYNADRKDNFSYEALRALFDYLTQLEEDLGEPIELDVIALCCSYHEIHQDEEYYEDYAGSEATREDYIIALLESSVLVREG